MTELYTACAWPLSIIDEAIRRLISGLDDHLQIISKSAVNH
jgi:hypothetical protein